MSRMVFGLTPYLSATSWHLANLSRQVTSLSRKISMAVSCDRTDFDLPSPSLWHHGTMWLAVCGELQQVSEKLYT
eukprot:755463-Hanusia_phi.AAC.3